MERPARFRTDEGFKRYVPVHVVWEITLACDLKCLHCGSRAGRRRSDELSTAECLDVVDALARLGTREVSLIGGEAYLRKDWTDIIRAVRSHGMYCAVQSGARQFTPKRLEAAVNAGLNGLGVSRFAGGNVRDLSLEQIWHESPEIHFGRMRSVDDLCGFCRTCYYADVCRGGCTWTSHSLLGRPGNNPYCHHRAMALDIQGLRERIAKIQEAGPASFAVGEFELITERITDGTVVESSRSAPKLVNLKAPSPRRSEQRDEGRIPPTLEICRACDFYIWPHEETCPHCGADVRVAAATHAEESRRRQELMAQVAAALP